MAKGRKLTTSRSERLLGSYGYGGAQGSSGSDPDLAEDEIWSLVDENATARVDHAPPIAGEAFSNGVVRSRRVHSHHHHHHREERLIGGLSLAFEDSSVRTASSRIIHQFRGNDGVTASPSGGHQMAASAPVNVPDWSKILRVDSVESLHEFDDYDGDYGGGDEAEMVPPHVYLAREWHSRKTAAAANSVFEGVGRTLKGRDMSRVRDAVWRQTGFDG